MLVVGQRMDTLSKPHGFAPIGTHNITSQSTSAEADAALEHQHEEDTL